MRAAVFDSFGGEVTVQTVPDPTPIPAGVVLRVRATGMCLSDWHAWAGHDPDIVLPHVPGHELAGEIVAVGHEVSGWEVGDRVTTPFVCACGTCPQCGAGQQQVCDRQSQPGFTHWGSFAEYVALERAMVNLVRLPEDLSFVTAASLGCRYATAFRAVVDQGGVRGGDWVAVHGCGGVGLSAVMIAGALGARVVAIDIRDEALAFAASLGAVATVNATDTEDVVEAVREVTGGGAHVSLDAFGSAETSFHSVANLRKRGTHVQVGLMAGADRNAPVPMDRVLADELRVVGSHGMQAHRYPELLAMIERGAVQPDRLVARTVTLEEGAERLPAMDRFVAPGVTVIDRF